MNSNNIEVSVIIPCFNCEDYIEDAVVSLVGGESSIGPMSAQSGVNFEIVIVDDGSSDDSFSKACFLTSKYHMIAPMSVLRTGKQGSKPKGTPVAINTGIESCHGSIISILHADDMMESWRLKELMSMMLSSADNCFVYDDIRVFANGTRGRHWPMANWTPSLLREYSNVHAGIMFSKEQWLQAGKYSPSMNNGREEWAFLISMHLAGFRGVHLHRGGYLYRREGQGRSSTNTGPKFDKVFIKQLTELFPDFMEED